MTFTIKQSNDPTKYIKLNWKHKYYVHSENFRQYKSGMEFYFKHQATDDSFHYIYVDGKVIGYGLVRDKGFNKSANKHYPWMWLNMLFIEPEFRGKGMGTEIMEYFKNLVRDTPHKTELFIDIDVDKENKNRLFKWYAKIGFEFDKKNPDDGNLLMRWKSEDWVEY